MTMEFGFLARKAVLESLLETNPVPRNPCPCHESVS